MSQLKEKTLTGLSWSTLAHTIQQGLTFGIGVALARLLSPEEFGLIGMVYVFIGLANVITEMGLGAVIIQKQDLDERHRSSIFWMNFGFGLLLTASVFFTSDQIARFYREPEIKYLASFLSIHLTLSSLGIVQRSLLIRNLEFRRLTCIETVAILSAGILGIGMALQDFGVWSLAWQAVCLSLATTLGLWITSSWRPKFIFSLRAVREIIGFGLNLMADTCVNYFSTKLDQLLIGRFLGSEPLGVYGKAYQLMRLPARQVSGMFTRVMFPTLSTIETDTGRIKRIYLRALRSIALVSCPAMFGLLVVAQPFVLTVFGPKWEGIVPILQIFCVTGFLQSLNHTTGWIYLSKGRSDWMFRWQLISTSIKALGIVIGLQWGIKGVALGYTTAVVCILFPVYAIPGRLINMKPSEVALAIRSVLLCGLLMAISVWGLDGVLPQSTVAWAELLILSGTGVLIYIALLHVFQVEAYLDIRSQIISHFISRTSL